MKQPLFSIVTTTYNRMSSGYLHECINSVSNQEGDGYDYEHIIVDDGSSDGTGEYVKGLAKSNPRIKYVYQDNAGPARATQAGVGQAKGDFIVIVDDDDALTPNSLDLRTRYINDNPSHDWFYGLADWVDEYGLPTKELFQSKPLQDHSYERLLISNYINAGTTTIKAKHLKKIEWPEWLSRSQDYFLWLELMRPEKKLKMGFLSAKLVRYRYHSNGYTSLLNTEEKKKEKAALNYRVKSLHPDSVAFLAEEAYRWVDEAHKATSYWKAQMKSREKRIDELQQALNQYDHSRFMQSALKVRNKLRGAQRRGVALFIRIKELPLRMFSTRPVEVTLIDNPEWTRDRPLVSVVTPFYNRHDTMPETIRSVLGQTMQDFEYIIVDDGSTTLESQQYLTKLKHEKITVIRQDNQGVAVARNNGIKKASGKYIICLDSDDVLDPTYVEKSVLAMEAQPDISLVTYDMQMFGDKEGLFRYPPHNSSAMLEDNYVITAAMFRRDIWKKVGGYKSGIGYEDWEFWTTLIEHGAGVKHIPEALFRYRTAQNSRYIDDLVGHTLNTDTIKRLHPHFKKKLAQHSKHLTRNQTYSKPKSVFVNYMHEKAVLVSANCNTNVLVAVPWMTFGGAETLIYNFCRELKNEYNLSFVTGVKSKNEWEYKFREVTPYIYHLPNLFDQESVYIEFIANYIKTRNIDILHIIHTGFVFNMLPELKKRYPELKIVVTMFNDRVEEYVEGVKEHVDNIDVLSTDNMSTADSFKEKIADNTGCAIKVIPNGIDCYKEFNPTLYNRDVDRVHLNIRQQDIAVFFVGRLSEEKNPDVFTNAARRLVASRPDLSIKFFIIGDGGMRQEVEKAVKAANSDNITYLGYRSDVAKYFNAADVFVLPSSIEGFPLSVLEAMAMETAVIASDVGAVNEVIEDGHDGFVITPGSVDQIERLIIRLAEEPGLLDDFKQAGRVKVEATYSSTVLGDNYKKLYEDV